MAISEFTNEQKTAINAKCPILVSAAAGSGKTAVLTERVIKKLTDKDKHVSADRLLIVTFTNAAAAEMRQRIEKRLYEESIKQPDNVLILKQKRMIGSADICTIDSFCVNLVRENFEKCGVEPNFKVTDGSDMKAVCGEILTDIIDRKLVEDKENITGLFELLSCEYDDKELRDIVEELYLYSRQIPFPEKFIEGLILPYSMPFSANHPIFTETKKIVKDYLENLTDCLENMSETAVLMPVDNEKCDNYAKDLSIRISGLNDKFSDFDWDEFRTYLYSVSVDRITVSSKNGEYGEKFKAYRKNFSDILSKLKALFSDSVSSIEEKNKLLLPRLRCLVDIINEYSELCFEAYKGENKLNFSHTEQLALNILCSSEDGEITVNEEAKAYLSRYDEVMVDEFQDVNDLQNMLFYILSDFGKKLFVVGDIKQSIYRFRGSNLNNFLNKKQTYIPFDKAKEDEPKKIILSDNFRSRKGICKFVNFVFSHILNEKTGQIVYDSEEELHPSATYPETDEISTDLLIVSKGEEDEDSLYEYEARAIADYINSLVKREFKVSDDGKTNRNVGLGDICILLDKVSSKAPILSKVLAENGIPVSFNNEPFCETAEISLLLSLLCVLDNPARDVELLCVLMSPLFGFTPDDLGLMRANCKQGNIYSVLLNSAQNGNEKAISFLEKIKKLRFDMAVLPLSKLIDKLIYDTGFIGIVSAMPNGMQRRKNILALQNLSSEFDYLSPTDFAEHIKSLPENSFKTDNRTAQNVSIMSMHKSKGLQFPVCILSDLSSRINTDDSISKTVYKDGIGIGFKYFDETQKAFDETLSRKIISRSIFAENLEEKMRLLYVAMTRAKEKLVLVTALKSPEKTVERIAENLEFGEIKPRFLRSVGSLGDFVLSSCLLHKDSQALKDIADVSVPNVETDSNFNLIFADLSAKTDSVGKTKEYEVSKDLQSKIEDNISYKYKYDELSKLEAKTSVSAVSKTTDSKEFYFADRPSFMNNGGMSSANKGTAIHNIMQFIEFTENPDIDSEIERLVEWQYITESQGECAEKEKIEAFFKSELYKRILKAKDVRREMRFLTKLPASRIDNGVSDEFKDTPVLVQGAVDLLFDEGDGIVVVDFKTDRVKTAENLISAYSEQLNIYALACERLFNKPVKEKIIYSFELGCSIPLLS